MYQLVPHILCYTLANYLLFFFILKRDIIIEERYFEIGVILHERSHHSRHHQSVFHDSSSHCDEIIFKISRCLPTELSIWPQGNVNQMREYNREYLNNSIESILDITLKYDLLLCNSEGRRDSRSTNNTANFILQKEYTSLYKYIEKQKQCNKNLVSSTHMLHVIIIIIIEYSIFPLFLDVLLKNNFK